MKPLELIRISAFGSALFVAGCDGSPEEDVARESEPVTIGKDAGAFSIDAPRGDYNAFSLDTSCSHDEGPDGGYSIWTRAAYSIATNLDCLDCLLPPSVVIGEPVADHEVSACLPSNAHVGCDDTADISGLSLEDLLAAATLENGEHVPVDSVGAMFFRVHEVWDEDIADEYGTTRRYPRIDIASTRLSVSSGAVVSVGAEWSFCDDALNSDDCLY